MLRRASVVSLLIWTGLALAPSPGLAQAPAPSAPTPISILGMDTAKERIWPIAGRVTEPDGKPVPHAEVTVDIGTPAFPPHKLQTNLLGEYRTEFRLDAGEYTKLAVKVVASKEGYSVGQVATEFKASEGVWETNLVLREDANESDRLSLPALVEALSGRFREPDHGSPLTEAAKEDYGRGVELLLDKRDAAGAVQALRSAVETEPECVACHTLLALALLDTGSWDIASQELAEAVDLTASGDVGTAASEPFLILGVLETWRHELDRGMAYLQKALKFAPSDPLALQELGRALMEQGKWGAAEVYLEKALQAGASPEARLMRIRTLLELGENSEAEAEMKIYLGGRQPMELPREARMVYARLMVRLQLRAYERAKSYVQQTPKELVHAVPELEGLEPASDQAKLAPVIARVRKNVASFFQEMPNTISREDIQEETLNEEGKVRASMNERFRYLLLSLEKRRELGLSEFRTASDPYDSGIRTPKQGFMRTEGFACTSLHLHPAYESKVRLRLLGRQEVDGSRTWVIAFAQRPENALVLGRFNAGGKSSPVLAHGVAWIDPDNYQILRMRTDLLKRPPDTELSRLTTVIDFGKVRFKEVASTLWLPIDVTVTVHWKRKFFRNRHHYSEYRLFNVETEERGKAASPPTASRQTPGNLN